MKRLIDFCLLLLMVFWGSNAWADKTMTFSATSPTTSDCNLTKLSASPGHPGSIAHGGITLTITAASDDRASWNTADPDGSNHGHTIALKTSANITISGSSAETKITKIVFHFEDKNKGHFTESSNTGGTLDNPTSPVNTQTWSFEKGANSVSLTSDNTKNKAYITSIEITYTTGGLDNQTVKAYPYTWNFTDESLWTNSESQFVSEIWTHKTANGDDEWRNTDHEPTVATGYDVDLLRGLRFTNHVCADRKRKCVSLPKTATITIPSLHEGQKVKISYTGVDILPKSNLKVSQERKDNIEIYKVTQDGDAILTVDNPNNKVWGVWISQISVLNAAPVLTMTTPANKATGVDPNLRSITVTSDKALWAYNVNGTKTPTEKTINATLTSDDEANNMEVTATFTAGETGVERLNFILPQGLESATTYTLNIPANVIMETSGTGNKNCSFTFSTKGLNYLGAYNGGTKIDANPCKVFRLDNNQVVFDFEEKLVKTDNFKVIVSDGTTVKTYTQGSEECFFSNDNKNLCVPVQLTAGKYYTITITAGSLKDAAEGTLKNNQIVLHLISSLEGMNLSMTTPYNQNAAPLTTRIILSANGIIKSGVEATLEGKSADGADGKELHNIGTVTGIANGNKLVFTPKEGQKLRPNYTYTLKLKEKAELRDVKEGKLPDDTFVFTTAKVTGDAPIVESTSPVAESTIPVGDVQPTTDKKKIKIKFNEDIQLLDGALIFCRPMGGSESYQSLEYYSARSGIYDEYNKIHADGNILWFEYSGQHLFYGMRYEVTIPTYAIVGNGGQPMEKNFKFYFETPKSAEASDSRARKDVYTWDFTNISDSTFTKIKESVTAGNTYWGEKKEGNDLEYGSSHASDSRTFAQGQEIKAGTNNTVLPELKGLLFNLVKNYNKNFQIVCNGSEDKGHTYLSLKGNTHYVTIQSVPAKAKVYIEHNGSNEMFNLNTKDVDSLKTFTNCNENRVSVYQLRDATKDLTFCVQNCKLYRIAIVKDTKTIGSADKNKNYIKYATYSQSYPVDYSLNAILNGTEVTAYSVSADYLSNAPFVNFTELPNNQSARDEGVILKTSGNLGESHPIFTTDVNTTPQELKNNALVGTTGDKATTEFDKAKKEGYQNYILTTKYFHLDKNENPSGEVIDGTQQCFYKWVKGNAKSNFAYLQLKNPSNANAAKTVIYLDWFGDTTGIHGVTAPSQVTSGKTYYTLDGRKVTSPTQKGIYIINGKKIIIK